MRKRIVLFLVGLILAGVAALAADPSLAGGPFVVNVSARSATIVWLVESGEAVVRPANDIDLTRPSPSIRVEKTTLTGLKANTRYEYKIPGYYDAEGYFTTPPTGDEPYNFIVYGDTRTRPGVHQAMVAKIIETGIPNFAIQTGDLVADGTSSALWPIFFDIEKQLLNKTAFYPTLGNHEHNGRDFYDYFQVATPYYSFDWGNAHFAVINSDIANVSKTESVRAAFWAEQAHWLEEDLKSHQSAEYRFVWMHHPPFTAVASRQGDNPHVTALTPMFEKYKVTATFFGHDHNYQHYLKNGVHYIITGGGGAPLYDVDKPPADIMLKVASVENFVTVSVDGKTAWVKAIALNGSTLDEFEFHGSAQPKPAAQPKKPTLSSTPAPSAQLSQPKD